MNNPEDMLTQVDLEPPLHRRPPRPLVFVGIIVLVLLVVLGSVTTVHILGNRNGTPTPTLETGSNLFYITTSPGWGTISIDGQKLSHLPVINRDQPLQLSPGIHQITWNAAPLPLQSCTLLVPPVVTTTRCLNSNNKVGVPKHRELLAFILSFSALPTMLPASQQTSLFQTTRAMLQTLQSSETVQAGEHYVDLQSSHFIATATQPLRATLRFQLDTNPKSNAPCQGQYLDSANSCSSQGADCHLFCAQQEAPSAYVPQSWNVFAVIRPVWDYTTLTGQVVTHDQPDALDNARTEYLITLSITWDGSKWHVTAHSPDVSSTTGLPNNTLFIDPACAAASSRIPQDTNFQSEESNPTISVNWEFASGSRPAMGCLAKAFQAPENLSAGTPKPIAYCLYRFGIFVAADAATQRYWPGLPVADAYEQSIAKQLEILPSS